MCSFCLTQSFLRVSSRPLKGQGMREKFSPRPQNSGIKSLVLERVEENGKIPCLVSSSGKKNYLGLGFDLFLASFPLKSSGFIINFKLFCYPSLNPRVSPRLKVRLAHSLCNRQCHFFNIWTLTSGAK